MPRPDVQVLIDLAVSGEDVEEAIKDFDTLENSVSSLRKKLSNLEKVASKLDVNSPEFRQLSKEIEKTEGELREATSAMRKFDKEVGQAQGGISSLDVALGNFAAGALQQGIDLLAEGAQRLFEWGSEGTQLAINFAETTSLLNQQLGPALDNYEEAIGRVGDETKRSSDRLLELGSTFVTLTTNAGFATSAAAELSAEGVRIATDLSSAFNLDSIDAIEKLNSAYIGSAEPLQSIGIDTREAALQQAALRAGIIDTLGPLDSQQRILAVNAAVLEQAAAATGNAALTADEAANKQKRLEDAYIDFQREVGEGLIPVQEELLDLQLQIVDAFGDSGVQAAKEFGGALSDILFITNDIVERNQALIDGNPFAENGFFAGFLDFSGSFLAQGSGSTGLGSTIAQIFDLASAYADAGREVEELASQVDDFEVGFTGFVLTQQDAALAAEELTARQQALGSALDAVAEKSLEIRKVGFGAADLRDREAEAVANLATTQETLNNQAQARLDREIAITQSYIDQQRELGGLVDLNSDILDTSAEQAFFDIALESGGAIGNLLGYAEAGGIVSEENRELIADSTLLQSKLIELNQAVEDGIITRSDAIQQFSDFKQEIQENTNNAGDLITEIDTLNASLAALPSNVQATVTLDVEGIELLREAAALRAGLTGTAQLVGQVGGAEANNILTRQLGAPSVSSAAPLPSTTQASSQGLTR